MLLDQTAAPTETAAMQGAPPSHLTTLVRIATGIVIAALGGFVAQLFGLPAAWLMGAALAAALAALLGARIAMPSWLRNSTFVLTGLSMGASVGRDSLAMMVQWPVTLAALAIELVIIVAGTGYMLRKLFKLDRGTAYLSSFPGHLSFIMSISAAGIGDPRQITIIQVLRILMLTICVPIGAMFIPGVEAVARAATPDIPLDRLLIVGVLCAMAGFAFTRLRVPAAYVLGAMAVSMSARFAGLFEGEIPEPMLAGTFILVGALIGSRFVGITAAEFRRAAFGGVIATLLTIAIVTVVALSVTPLVDMPFGQIWLGLSPGALEGMGALGVALGFDTAFIAAHHVSRLLILTVTIPIVAMLARDPRH